MVSVSKRCNRFCVLFVSIWIFSKFDLVFTILHGGSTSSTSATPILRTSTFQEGQAQHQFQQGKVARVERKRQLSAAISTSTTTAAHPGACECIDYWECISNNGHVYSYCGINDSEVCCFSKYKNGIGNSENNNGRERQRTRNNANKSSAAFISTISFAPHTSTVESSVETFATGNTISQNDGISFSTPSPDIPASSTLPDVDYFYSLEDGVGDLRQISSEKEKSAEVLAKPPVDGNYSGSSCGTQSVEWKLNSRANFKEWPWHVALLEINQDVYICGGTLISNEIVVTAAHCVYSYARRTPPKLKVRAGEYDVSTNDEEDPYFEVVVEKIVIHPEFSNATLVNDIALVKLRRPLNYTSNIKPICLPRQEIEGGHLSKSCVVVGWGRETENSHFSVVLKEIVVPIWKRQDCEERLRQNFGTSYQLAETAICAGERGHDACDGDGGGGLVCFDEQRQLFNLKGITSFGIGCGRLETPGVYTSVASYLSWIEASLYYMD